MGRRRNRGTVQLAEVLDVEDRSTRSGWLNLQGLVEITIVDRAVVGHADEMSAHQPLEIARVEMIDEQRHVRGVFAVAFEFMGESLDRHIRDREETIENDAEFVPF